MARVTAVASGKGGVGKTTTVTNLGIYAARKGLRVAVIDVDPLSDIAELLDLPNEKFNDLPNRIDTSKGLAAHTVSVFERLDLLFPLAKVEEKESKALLSFLQEAKKNNFYEKYDIVLLDMPAGSDEEENIAYLPLADQLIIVTTPDPASHVAAGNYLYTALESAKDTMENLPVLLWHNRYNGVKTASFRPNDVIGNYNRNMPEGSWIDPDSLNVQHAAFIPDDASLDLLRGGVAVQLQLLRNLVSSLDALHDTILTSIPIDTELSDHMRMLLRFFLRNRSNRDESDTLLEDFGNYLRTILGIASDEHSTDERGRGLKDSTPIFSSEQGEALKQYFIRCNDNRTRAQLLKAQTLVQQKLDSMEQESSLFGTPQSQTKDPKNTLDRELSALLMFLEEEVRTLPQMRNHAALVLFYFALYKLLQSDKVRSTLDNFVPHRKENEHSVRDRHYQIMRLIEGSKDYRKRYLSLIKNLLPLVFRQIDVMSKTFELHGLIFRSNGSPAKDVYAKLTGNFIHEAVHSGLGIVVGLSHRPSSVAFEKAAGYVLGRN